MSSLLTIPEAAAYLKISRAKIYQLLKADELPARKIGGKTVFLPDELEKYAHDLPVWTGRA